MGLSLNLNSHLGLVATILASVGLDKQLDFAACGLPLPIAPVLLPHHVGAVISDWNSGWSVSRMVTIILALPDILSYQVLR